MKFDHIGITTHTLAAGRTLLAAVGIEIWTEAFEDHVNDVWVQFGKDDMGVCFELVAPLSKQSPVLSVLSKKINVINHIAYLVDNIAAQAVVLGIAGFVEVSTAKPAIAYANQKIQFFVSSSRMLVELIEAPHHQHNYLRGLDDRRKAL